MVVQNKKRTSFFQFMNGVKEQFGLQNRINAKQVQLNTNQIITNEEILARLANLERIVLPAQHRLQKQNVFRRFWDWTLGK
ncbi:hypothetical protein RO04_00820 [Aggregatibacter actinomycetemcomitans]|nr:hypothetical protein A160_0207535 [Aggregatibacter actinomycetemcomitans serotype e str. A160]KOE67841.1 hypothetical protein SCC393_0303210 [Aggregatibacter actinomycetemcomitans serotype e str. SCC393]KOE69108.1 hypothetical protein D18P1_0310400 [Aggregatibacter actinomycetemcomitans serotype f str. D18P1]KYK73973.1 hypothetical protein SA2876_09125 [Aggregatibacter actinomycetemcomitans serotype e str. SA2876]KYK87325.1 hypothetical protein SC29R_06875 [Aggregatibacter actinomycetemcomit